MKKTILCLVLAGAASPAFAQNFTAHVHHVRPATQPPYAERIVRDGGLQRAARIGNPAQALNPFAPAEYGTGERYVEYRQSDPFLRLADPAREHPVALRLFAFEF